MSFAAAVFLTVVYLISSTPKVMPLNDDILFRTRQISGPKKEDGADTDEISCSECGIGEDATRQRRMIDGPEVNSTKKYPWLVDLRTPRRVTSLKLDHHCGGSIINERFILTAAHCLDKMESNPGRNKVMLMSESPDRNDFQEGPPIEEIIKHEKYIRYGQNLPMFDIGLIKLKEPIKCTPYARPICLPPKDYKAEPGEFISAGWGWDDPGGGASDILREGYFVNEKVENCTRPLGPPDEPDHTFCIKPIKNTVPCYGDSGSPLLKQVDGKWYVIGTLSGAGKIDCHPDYPPSFMSVPYFLDWIHNKTGLGSPNN